MRQFIAIAIVFYATRYLYSRRYILFCVLTGFATIFHTSAVLGFVCLGIEFLNWKDLNKKQRRFLIVLSIGGLALSGYLISTINSLYYRYRHYFLVVNRNVGFRVLALIAILVVSAIIYRNKSRNPSLSEISHSDRYFLRTTRLYYLVACGLGSLGYFYDYMTRLGFFFYPFIFVYFGFLIKDESATRRIIFKMMIYFVIAYVLFQYLFVVNGSGHHPYHVVWNW